MRNFDTSKTIFKLKKVIETLEGEIRVRDANLEHVEKRHVAISMKLKESQTLSRCLKEKTDRANKENRNLFLALVKMVELFAKVTGVLGGEIGSCKYVSGFWPLTNFLRKTFFRFFQLIFF